MFDELGCREYRKKYRCPTTEYEMSFLIGLIDKYRFSNGERIKRVFEVGVLYGTTSLSLLKQGCKNDEFYLYGIDKGNADLFGEAVFNEASKEELEHYELHKGSTTADIENILKDKEKLDMIFIDAKHAHPYPLIDLIYLIPFLRKDALICMHDTLQNNPSQWGPGYIYLLWNGQKYRNYNLDNKLQPKYKESLSCIVINQGKEKFYKNLLDTANIPYRAVYIKSTSGVGSNCYDTEDAIRINDDCYLLNLNEKDIAKLKIFIAKYYDEQLAADISEKLWSRFEEYQKAWPLYFCEKRNDVNLYNTTKNNAAKISQLEKELNKTNELNLHKTTKTMQQKISQLEKELNKINDLRKNIWRYRIKYFRYVAASKITFGKTRQKYKAKRELLKAKLYS